MRMLLSVAVAILALAGCNEPPPEKTVFDPQVRALKKARALEGQVQQAAEQRRAREPEQESQDPAAR